MNHGNEQYLDVKQTFTVGNKNYLYYSLPAAAARLGDINRLPFSLKILLENLLRNQDNKTVTLSDIKAVVDWQQKRTSDLEIAFRPARVLMQDFTGVPAIVDLAAMRDVVAKMGGNPDKINPKNPVDLVVDHSVQVDDFGKIDSLKINSELDGERNQERYEFLRWGQKNFDNFRVVPPGTGICHQVNLEYIAQCVWSKEELGSFVAYPDTLVGTDSHTTMINGLGVLGWGVGGIEAEAAMLGQPISMLLPEVVGFKLEGKLREGITATDLVLTVTQMLRKKGVVGKFVEFYGPGLHELPLADRATIANMAPEYGATCGFFPIDKETIHYLRLSGRAKETIELVEAYCKAQGLWHDENTLDPLFTDTLTLNLSTVEPSLAGPKRPQDRVNLTQLTSAFDDTLDDKAKAELDTEFSVSHESFKVKHGDVVIAAITSCTNTSNPSVLMAAGLLAKKALEKGLSTKPWVKTSLAPGSKVVTEYLHKAGLQAYLDQLGFNIVGYGCTTCIGNSGPLPEHVSKTIQDNNLVVSAVLSGNRNFEGRVHPQVKANWLASPPLVVAFALAGSTRIDLTSQALGHDKNGQPVYLKDIWPTNQEVATAVAMIDGSMFRKEYEDVFKGDLTWQSLPIAEGKTYNWNSKSTYVKNPPYFEGFESDPRPIQDISGAHVLAVFGDSITTDHISPAGSIKADSPAGLYLQLQGIAIKDFNSYGSRRGNHEIMMRGTFANIRIKNEMLPGTEGGITRYVPNNEKMPIYDAAMKYSASNTPLVIIAGKEYGTGSSRDWAAKGTVLLGVKAVIAESFERIHRSNLIGMGVLPLEFLPGNDRKSYHIEGNETFNIVGLQDTLKPQVLLNVEMIRANQEKFQFQVRCRLDTSNEVEYYRHGGILHYVLRNMIKS